MPESGGIRLLVADSNAFIKGVPLEKLSDQVVTVKEVVSEIRDAETRRRLQVLPYELSFREPSQSAIRHVTEFSKKTGDYVSLSAVDLKLIALVYQLECELGPEKGRNLREAPVHQPSQLEGSPGGIFSGNTPGFYKGPPFQRFRVDDVPESDKDGVCDGATSSHADDVVSSDPCQSNSQPSSATSSSVGSVLIPELKKTGEEKEGAAMQDVEVSVEQLAISVPETKDEHCHSEQQDHGVSKDSDGESDEEGWITPENIREVCEQMGGVEEVESNGVAVGCVTTDYAMQNVMMQLGLNVISKKGMLVKQLKTYALHCKACFRTTFKMGSIFCPSCGNKTLIKVSAQVREDGAFHYHAFSKRQFSREGLRFPLPLRKGGRHEIRPVLTADQRVTSRLPRSRCQVGPLDPNYVAQTSPFRVHDVTSRAAQVMFAGKRDRMPRNGNPNRVRKKKK